MLSCIQPTGSVHLGNHLGALINWVAGQHDGDVYHGIVDLHALTVIETPGLIGSQTLELAAMLFAVGLDPDVATVFVQSHIHEHSELSWIMECTVSYGELSRMTQFKDKSAKNADNINAGLFDYPVLMAADILLYQAQQVPVGDDQKQHLELTRDVATRFNSLYGPVFTIPEPMIPPVGARIMGLQDPTAKMSKSGDAETDAIYLLDAPDVITRKIKRAVTDMDGVIRHDIANKPGVSNLLSILSAITGESFAALEERFTGKGYGHLKGEVADAVVACLKPVQDRYTHIRADTDGLKRVLRDGADKASARADTTLKKVYEVLGFIPA